MQAMYALFLGQEKKAMTILFMLFVYSILSSVLYTASTLETIDTNQFIRDGDTLASPGGIFELGFFSPANMSTRYLGIWYKNITPQTVVWVANRKFPLSDASGSLNLTRRGILILLNSANNVVWSSKNAFGTRHDAVAQLLDSGNLVVRQRNDSGPDKFLWQSFDYPCDTLLPGMKLGVSFSTGIERYLSSWPSQENPAPGKFIYQIETHGYPQLVVKWGPVTIYRTGSWNGVTWTGTPFFQPNPAYWTLEFELNEKGVYYVINSGNDTPLTRLLLSPSKNIRTFIWRGHSRRWVDVSPVEAPGRCVSYALCGAYGICSNSTSPICSCLNGFVPKSPRKWNSSDWSGGCVRKTPLDCSKDRFLQYTALKLPDTWNSSWFNSNLSLSDCQRLCLKNCSCTAYANLDVRGTGCLLWHGDLIDITTFEGGGQDLYVRAATSELRTTENKRSSGKKKQAGIIAGSVVSAAIMLVLPGMCFSLQRKNIKQYGIGGTKEEMELPILDLVTIANATNNFSSGQKLGQGGFGPVYKGTLIDGQEIAVKRLSKCSHQGENEFKTEVMLIAKLHHRNLVKLLGLCINEDEKMLVYEYMSNKSLDSFIFDKKKNRLLNWQKRITIIEGVARGLLYLHQDSRLKVIHRDLKASNILLDIDLNPKISDFGLARTFGIDQYQAKTKVVMGTYGYMAPEYAVDGLISVKSDVFSFGVLVLEIISGKRNRGFNHPDHEHNLLGHAWMLWTGGTPLEVVDECLVDSCNACQVKRCTNIALLCVQQRPEDRPTMLTVVLMLGSDISLPQPKHPGFFIARNPSEVHSSTSNNTCCTGNTITETILEAR